MQAFHQLKVMKDPTCSMFSFSKLKRFHFRYQTGPCFLIFSLIYSETKQTNETPYKQTSWKKKRKIPHVIANQTGQKIKPPNRAQYTWAWWAWTCVCWPGASSHHRRGKISGTSRRAPEPWAWHRGGEKRRRFWPWWPRDHACGTSWIWSAYLCRESDSGFGSPWGSSVSAPLMELRARVRVRVSEDEALPQKP